MTNLILKNQNVLYSAILGYVNNLSLTSTTLLGTHKHSLTSDIYVAAICQESRQANDLQHSFTAEDMLMQISWHSSVDPPKHGSGVTVSLENWLEYRLEGGMLNGILFHGRQTCFH